MIRVVIYRDNLEHIQGFEATGHSGYAAAGQDIVCAAVSAVTQTAVMGLKSVAEIDVDYNQKKGWSHCVIPLGITLKQREAANLILETMLIGLKSMELQYRSFISVQERKVE